MVKKRNIAAVKVKKKKWYPILASKSFNEKVLGESLITDPLKLKGKFMKINLSIITNNFRDQNINLTFKVNSVIDNKGHTEIMSYNILSSFIKRFVRRDKSKVADSFVVKDKTGQRIRVKPLIITHNTATKSQKTEIRKISKDFLKKYIMKTTLEMFINDLMRKDVQKKLRSLLKKTMPIKYAEVRSVGYDDVKLILSKKESPVPEDVVEEIKEINETTETKTEKPTEKEEVKVEEKTEAKKEEVKKSSEEAVEKKVEEEKPAAKETVIEKTEEKVSAEESEPETKKA